MYTSGCDDEVDPSCDGPGLECGAGCDDALLLLGDLGVSPCVGPVLADGGSDLVHGGSVLAQRESISSGSAP